VRSPLILIVPQPDVWRTVLRAGRPGCRPTRPLWSGAMLWSLLVVALDGSFAQ